MTSFADQLNSFYEHRTEGLVQQPAVHEQGKVLHEALVRSIDETAPVLVARRRASMCHDGTPAVHSLELTRATVPSYRLLVEPGGVGISVAEQINHSLRAADGILHALGWESTVTDLSSIVTRIFPSQAASVSHWWGGIWLGMAVGSDGSELRVYLNLRHGEALARWQRVGDVLSFYAEEAFGPFFTKWFTRVFPHAIPVGLGVVVAGERLRGLRVYFGLYHPSLDVIRSMRMDPTENGPVAGDCDLAMLCNAFTRRFGDFAPQTVTVGHDFRLSKEGILEPRIVRTKVDLSCQLLGPEAQAALPALLDDHSADWGFDAGYLREYLDDLRASFGGSDIEFLSAGFRDNLDHVTVYTKPSGYARA